MPRENGLLQGQCATSKVARNVPRRSDRAVGARKSSLKQGLRTYPPDAVCPVRCPKMITLASFSAKLEYTNSIIRITTTIPGEQRGRCCYEWKSNREILRQQA